MVAVITGASSGIGLEMAKILSERGWDIVLVARRQERLLELQKTLKTKSYVIPLDLSKPENCIELYNQTKDLDVQLLINGAGFGVFGRFDQSDIDRELSMIDLNIKTLHILTKLYLKDFMDNKKGYILNIASAAGFMAGPLLSSYYASKNYVLRLSQAIYEEQKKNKTGVVVSALCPGPVDTEFNDVADVNFAVKGLNSKDVAKYALDKLFQGKGVIIPGNMMKCAISLQKFVPQDILVKITYHIQSKKVKD